MDAAHLGKLRSCPVCHLSRCLKLFSVHDYLLVYPYQIDYTLFQIEFQLKRARCEGMTLRDDLVRFYQRVHLCVHGSCCTVCCWRSGVAGSIRDYQGFILKSINRSVTLHRFMVEVTHGALIFPGFMVCHACDNPGCCNPAHLFIGSPSDNTRDAMRKGRLAYGRSGALPLKRALRKLRDRQVFPLSTNSGAAEAW